MAKTSFKIDDALRQQVDTLAQQLNISRDEVIERALRAFVADHAENDRAKTPINQGDIFWVQLADPSGTEPGIPHPHVVIQADVINHSRVDTVVVCALTSAPQKARPAKTKFQRRA